MLMTLNYSCCQEIIKAAFYSKAEAQDLHACKIDRFTVQSGKAIVNLSPISLFSYSSSLAFKHVEFTYYCPTGVHGQSYCHTKPLLLFSLPFPSLSFFRISPFCSRSVDYVAFCVSGYRSAIATSLLRKAGFRVRDIFGGFAAINWTAPSHTTSGAVSWLCIYHKHCVLEYIEVGSS